MGKIIKKYAINILLIAVISIASIAFALHGDFAEIKAIIYDISLPTLTFLSCLGMIPYVLEAFVLKVFSNLYLPTYSFKDGFINAMTGAFFSGITPFASGGQFAQAIVFKKQGVNYANSTGILLMHFILYQICLVIYTFFIMIFKFNEIAGDYNGFLSLALIGFLCNTVVIIVLIAGALSYRFQHFLTGTVLKVAHRLHFIKNYEYEKNKLENYLVDFHKELKVIQRHPKEMGIIIFLFILKLTVLYSIPYIIAWSLGHNVSMILFGNYFAICAFIYLITAFIPIPGASGGSEGTFVLLYSSLMGSVLARSSMIIWRFTTYYVTIFLGFIIFMVFTNLSRRDEP